MIFSILSLTLFHVSGSDLANVSAFSNQFYKLAKKSYLGLIALASLSILTTYLVMRVSKLFFILTTLSVAVLVTLHLTEHFSKLITVLLFAYIVVAYYYYQFLNIEIYSACYKPNFNSQNLFDPMLYKISCRAELSETQVIHGYLTNWDENGCFVKFLEPTKLPKEFLLTVTVSDEKFEAQAKIVSRLGDDQGYGLKFKQRPYEKHSWSDFINFTNDMGLLPETVQ